MAAVAPSPGPGPTPPGTPVDAYPSAQWTGTIASGFGGSNPAAPTDPARTTAKPILHPLVPVGQAFDEADLIIGFQAYAKGGISKVRLHIEGNQFDQSNLEAYTYTASDGNSYTVWGYWFRLKHSLFPANGRARIYAEAFPVDATMQNRVIPTASDQNFAHWHFTRRPSGALHDYSITVAATPAEVVGSRYKTLSNAYAYLASVSAKNPLVTITETGNYDPGSFNYQGCDGYCTVTTAGGVTATMTLGTWTNWQPLWGGLRFKGRGIRFDKAKIKTYTHNQGTKFIWFDGSEIYNSLGRDRLADSGFIEDNAASVFQYENLIATETYSHDMIGGFPNRGWFLLRNTRIENVAAPFSQFNRNVYGGQWANGDNRWFRTQRNALVLSYSGAGAGTFSTNGTSGLTSTTLTLVPGGTINLSSGGVAKTVAAVAAEINAMADWTATLGTDHATFTAPYLVLPGTIGSAAIPSQDAKSSPVTLNTFIDSHSDIIVISAGGTVENVAAANAMAWNVYSAVPILVTNSPTMRDIALVNLGFQNNEQQRDEVSGTANHLIVWNYSGVNTEPNWSSLSGKDSYTSWSNCIHQSSSVFTGISPAEVDSNQFITGPSPTGSTNTTLGSTIAALLNSPSTGDFRPRTSGPLKTGASRIPFDALGNARGATSYIGAVAVGV